VTRTPIAIIGAGPYGLSLAAHLAARKIDHRIFGHPMQFWSQIAAAGGERYLKSFCFGTNISTPKPGFTFADYSRPRGLETFEPCSIRDFAGYGQWFQQSNIGWVEPVDVKLIATRNNEFIVTLATGEQFAAARVVVATGLAGFEYLPPVLSSLSPCLVTHTSRVADFAAFKGREVAVIGAGQSALEAAALLNEHGATPILLVREHRISWHHRTPVKRNLWRRLRSPLSGLGSGPTAWALTHFPGMVHRAPESWRTRFVRRHLPPEGAWWLRERVERRVLVRFGLSVVKAGDAGGRVTLRVCDSVAGINETLVVDHVVAGTGYMVDTKRLHFLCPELGDAIARHHGAPRLNSVFEASFPGLHFIGPSSAMSFGPLFRFVAGAEYTAAKLSAHLAARALRAA
jgi:lysine/ornithine N-monooxygenase